VEFVSNSLFSNGKLSIFGLKVRFIILTLYSKIWLNLYRCVFNSLGVLCCSGSSGGHSPSGRKCRVDE
jgi:hypothetical protein